MLYEVLSKYVDNSIILSLPSRKTIFQDVHFQVVFGYLTLMQLIDYGSFLLNLTSTKMVHNSIILLLPPLTRRTRVNVLMRYCP